VSERVPQQLAADNVFFHEVQYQLCSVSENTSSGGYDASLGVGIML